MSRKARCFHEAVNNEMDFLLENEIEKNILSKTRIFRIFQFYFTHMSL